MEKTRAKPGTSEVKVFMRSVLPPRSGINPRELAEAAGTSRTTLYRVLHGTHNPAEATFWGLMGAVNGVRASYGEDALTEEAFRRELDRARRS